MTLAEVFSEVICITNANPDMVVEQLINEYELLEKCKIMISACKSDEDTMGNLVNIYEDDSIWHDVSEEPNENTDILFISKNGK